jgi:hypothetical protein
MRSRGLRWRNIRPHLFITLPVTLAVALALWIAYPSVASDFGIIPYGQPPGDLKLPPAKPGRPLVLHRLHIPGPKFWRDGPPKLSDLQASAVQVWEDVKRREPELVAEGKPAAAALQTVATDVRIRLRRYREYLRINFHPDTWVVKDQYAYYTDQLRHHCDEPEHQNEQRCRQHVPTTGGGMAVPEPGVWSMLLIGIAGLGFLMRRGRVGRAAV